MISTKVRSGTRVPSILCSCKECGGKAMLITKIEVSTLLEEGKERWISECLDCGIVFTILIGPDWCEECGSKIPAPTREQRDGGYFEFITVCPDCGATYTGGV